MKYIALFFWTIFQLIGLAICLFGLMVLFLGFLVSGRKHLVKKFWDKFWRAT